jgi:NADH-quinone oxidoreductase subunit L
VTALIHAATMVTAGVYMVARSHVLFLHAPVAMTAVAVIGCLTALLAASIALVQTDIKKVLAYSTVSQLGYMFLACGVGAFSAGVFHLMTHAFFKGLLFLGAGSVIHAMGGEQDLRRMGGLRKHIPWTYGTMLAACLAMAGAPGFAGFFSKDEILLAARSGPYANLVLYTLGVVTAGMTSFYIFRLFFLTFHGDARYDEKHAHVHESPSNMLTPLVVLALLSVAGGWWAAPHLFGDENYFERFLAPVFTAAAMEIPNPGIVGALLGAPVVAGLAGFLIAWWMYIKRPDAPARLAESLRGVYHLLAGKYFVDELYATAVVRPLLWLSTNLLWHAVDERTIDAGVNGLGRGAARSGDQLRRLNSGNTRSYAAWIIVGAVLLTTVLLWMAP